MTFNLSRPFMSSFWRRIWNEEIKLLATSTIFLQILNWIFPKSFDDHKREIAIAVSSFVAIRFITLARETTVQRFENNFEIRLSRGNIFTRKVNAIIGFSDTFEVELNNPISPLSLQGQLLSNVWENDSEDLKNRISEALLEKGLQGLSTSGKSRVFPLGTVIMVEKDARKFFLSAYSTMNSAGHAKATVESMTSSLYSLWDEISLKSSDQEIAVPLIGQGNSRLSVLTPEISLRLIALTFVLKANASRVCPALHIIVRKEDWKKIDSVEFKNFLKSLPGSRK